MQRAIFVIFLAAVVVAATGSIFLRSLQEETPDRVVVAQLPAPYPAPYAAQPQPQPYPAPSVTSFAEETEQREDAPSMAAEPNRQLIDDDDEEKEELVKPEEDPRQLIDDDDEEEVVKPKEDPRQLIDEAAPEKLAPQEEMAGETAEEPRMLNHRKRYYAYPVGKGKGYQSYGYGGLGYKGKGFQGFHASKGIPVDKWPLNSKKY